MFRAGRGVSGRRPALTTGTISRRWHVMAAHQDSDIGVIYQEIPWAKGYRVGSDGSVWSRWARHSGIYLDEWRPMSPARGRSAHLHVNLSYSGRRHRWGVSRLVLTVFVGPCPVGLECCHEDGNPTNNAVENLRWDTRQSNVDDKKRHGTMCLGENVGNAKLKDSDIEPIRRRYSEGETMIQIARDYGVRYQTISRIVKRQGWLHVAG